MTPGKWQITYHTTSPIDLPPMVSTVCVDAGQVSQVGPPKPQKDAECQVVTPAFDGANLSYGMECAKSGVKSEIKMRFLGNSYSGDVTVTRGGSVITQHIEAVRVGACDEP